MTYKDVYTKFLIDYDKANVTSSYPSLTEFEAAVILDKAYKALIAQKTIGNNVRKIGFEGDIKVTEDIAPLVESVIKTEFTSHPEIASNVVSVQLPARMYYLHCYLPKIVKTKENLPIAVIENERSFDYILADKVLPSGKYITDYLNDDVSLHLNCSPLGNTEFPEQFRISYSVTKEVGVEDPEYLQHDYIADNGDDITSIIKSTQGSFNLLQIKDIVDLEGNIIDIDGDWVWGLYTGPHYDVPADKSINRTQSVQMITHLAATKFYASVYNLPWIKIPVGYIEGNDLYIVFDPIDTPEFQSAKIVYIKDPVSFTTGSETDLDFSISNTIDFECSDAMAYELVDLAVTFALEKVESPRLNSKLNTRGLEA